MSDNPPAAGDLPCVLTHRAAGTRMNLSDELKKLHDLHLAGGITREEWARLKASLLGITAAPAAPPPDAPDPAAGPAEPLVRDAMVPGVMGEKPAAPPTPPKPTAVEAAPQPPVSPATPTPPPEPKPKPAPAPYVPPWRRNNYGPVPLIVVISVVFVGLAKLGVVPVSCAAKMPGAKKFFEDVCFECSGTGKARQMCMACFGRGYIGGAKCGQCGGSGKKESACQYCAGSGKKPTK